jgi:amidohydrolase
MNCTARETNVMLWQIDVRPLVGQCNPWEVYMPVINSIAAFQDDLTAWRRDLHAHPEVLYEVQRTAALVAERLRDFACDEVVEGIGRTGVVGVIHGRTRQSGRVMGLRADMDALPMSEATGLPYASNTPGSMHACGHDGHTTMLLGAARYLSETRNFDGTAVVIFQPAEEGGAGAKAMLDDGLLERFGIQEFYGLHNWPGLEKGQFAIRPGPFFATADQFDIYVTGKGGHAAKPQAAVDTTLIAAQMVVALQSIVSRNADPLGALVVSVTSIKTDSHAYNVIPARVHMRGTVRSLDKAVQLMAEERIKTVVGGIAQAFGGAVEVDYRYGYPVMSNHAEQAEFAAKVAETITPNVDRDTPIFMGGEDFAFMLLARPGAYILLGNGDSAPLHHPEYDFSDDVLATGSTYFAKIVEMGMPV